MIVSIDWIRQFVDLPEEVNDDLARRFTLATCEVEEVKKINEHLEKVIVVEITGTEPHPQADKLQLATINTGREEKVIVCGAPNARPGIKVPYAPVGTTLPDGLTLDARKVRGILSEGMLCGETELEIGTDDEGLKEFPLDAPVGTSLSEYLNLPTDILFDIDNKSLTNRPDLWAQYGMAREFAAVFRKELKNPFDAQWEEKMLSQIPGGTSPVSHSVAKESACKGYYGLAIEGIKVGESPSWVQKRLISCGLRPINSLVDISNYVLLELGIPNHIFDMKKIRGSKIEVKRAGKTLKMTTLDEVERDIAPEDTLIWDGEGPVAVAGIMGGLDSSVTEETTSIFIECANFTDAEIRKTATRLGLRTDSSLRYEKSLDTHLLKRTALRLLDLIQQLNPEANVIGSLNYEGEDLSIPPCIINTSAKKISSVLGKEISQAEIIEILHYLDYEVSAGENDLHVRIPTYRATKDIEVEADIIEEIGRIIGYDNIEPESPSAAILPTSLTPEKKLHRRIADFMVLNKRAFEVMTYPMIGAKLLEKCGWNVQNEELQLVNAISRDHDRMRPSLVPTILSALQLNSRNEKRFSLFEIGRAYTPDAKEFSKEENWLACAFYDQKENRIMDAVNCAEELLSVLNLSGRLLDQPSNGIFPEDWIGTHPYEHITIQIHGKTAGAIMSIHPMLASKLKIKGKASIVLLNLSGFEKRGVKDRNQYHPLPKFPGSEFDCTVVAPQSTAASEVLKPVQKLKIKEIIDVKIADIFRLNDNEKTITVKTHFLDKNKTLEGSFLEESKNKIIAALEKSGFPLKQ